MSYEVDEGKKLFFHTSEVEGSESLQEGDEVEFVVVTNKRTGKHSACCVRKLRYVCFKYVLKSRSTNAKARGQWPKSHKHLIGLNFRGFIFCGLWLFFFS